MIDRILIVGTGLIGASIGLALREAGFPGRILGWDADHHERIAALNLAAVHEVAHTREEALSVARHSQLILLAVPVMAILDWMTDLAPLLRPGQLVTDVGSTKLEVSNLATRLFPQPTHATFLPGHPMAGKESGGASQADPNLFRNAMWLFTPAHPEPTAIEEAWRHWVTATGARTMDLDAAQHDQLCAWVSHMPQMVATAIAAMLEDQFGDDPNLTAIGGRALREMTRLGASPYSMWRDVALTNTAPLAETLHALEQRLAHIRENLRTPELRDEFRSANTFRARF